MGATIGKAQTQNLINQALFFVSIGSNDFIENYKLVPIRSLNYTVSAYIDFLLQHSQQFLQELLDEGVRKIAVTGLGPLGCLPSIITVHSENAFSKRECVDSISSMAREFNVKIQKQLKATQNKFANLGSRIGYVEVYKPTMDILLRPKSHGFENINTGCCGTAFLEFALSCNPLSYVCPNVSKNYFWDSVHPTERAYYLITQAILPTLDSITK
ncbi:hypothetical protein P3L10_027733 [Capsicum annuum]